MHIINYGALLESLRVADRKECIYTYSDGKPCCVVGWYLYLCGFDMDMIEKNKSSLIVNYNIVKFLGGSTDMFDKIQEIWDNKYISDHQARDKIYDEYIRPFAWL